MDRSVWEKAGEMGLLGVNTPAEQGGNWGQVVVGGRGVQIYSNYILLNCRWEKQGHVDRSVWEKAGEMGLLGVNTPAEQGGIGADILHAAIVWEEQ